MTVYIVFDNEEYDGKWINAIFQTRDAADSWCRHLTAKYPSEKFLVEDHQVEDDDDVAKEET